MRIKNNNNKINKKEKTNTLVNAGRTTCGADLWIGRQRKLNKNRWMMFWWILFEFNIRSDKCTYNCLGIITFWRLGKNNPTNEKATDCS